MKCYACSRNGPFVDFAVCQWPSVEIKAVSAKHLRPGTLVTTSPINARKPVWLTVVSVGRPEEHGIFSVKTDGPGLAFFPYGSIRAQVPGICGHNFCDLHRVERGEKLVYCLDHARAWESAA